MDLEEAAEIATVKIKELSAHVDKAEAAFTALEERLGHVKTRFETDWAALDERAHALLETARAQAGGIAEEAEEAREGLSQLDESLGKAAPEWNAALEGSASETSTLGAHVSEQGPPVSEQGGEAQAATRALARRAAATEAQLQQAAAEARELLEGEVARELREMRDAVRQRAAALQAALTEECAAELAEAFTGWERQLAEVEEVIDEEFASARQHAAAVVEFSLQECQRGHEDAWAAMASLMADVDGVLERLGQTVGARTSEIDARRTGLEEALSGTAAGVERMRALLAGELETLARYEFVRA